MDKIRHFGEKTLTSLRQGKDTLRTKLGSFRQHTVSSSPIKDSQSKMSLKQKALQFKHTLKESLPQLPKRQAIFNKKETKFPDFVVDPEDTLSEKTPLELAALPLPQTAEGLSKRIAFLENKIQTLDVSARERPVLEAELEHLKFLKDKGPLSLEAHVRVLSFKQEAADLVLHRLAEHKRSLGPDFELILKDGKKTQRYEEQITKAQKAVDTYFRNKTQEYIETLASPLGEGKETYKSLQADIKTIQRDIAKILMEHELHSPGTKLEGLIQTLEHTHNKIILNTQNWEPVHDDIYCYTKNGSPQKFTSVLTPALHLKAGLDYQDLSLSDVRFTSAKRHEGQVNLEGRIIQGLSSEMQHSKHAVNLWKSDLYTEGSTGEKKLLGSVFRHGVLAAYQDRNDLSRKEKNINRAKEVVTAMVHTSLKDKIAGLKDGDTLEVPIVATNLQSASDTVAFAKHVLKPGHNEKVHIQEHMKAWKDLKAFPVNIDGKTITVQPKPITFNFGVNVLSVGKASKLASTWRSVKAANQTGMEALLGKDYLAGDKENIGALNPNLLLPETDASGKEDPEAIWKNRAIRALAQDVHAIFNSKAYQSEGVDPYKLVARISALAILSGQQASINCKSGKDRTSVCDAEIKHLLSHIAMSQGEDPILPSYEKPLDGPERKNYQNFIFAKANFTIQEKNTGIAGYKCGGVPSLFEKVAGGSSYLKDLFVGGSKCVKV